LGCGGSGDSIAVRVVGHRVPGAARDRRGHVAVAVAGRHAAGVVQLLLLLLLLQLLVLLVAER